VTAEQWARLKEVFAEALEKEVSERDEFVARVFEGEPELLAQARRLLASYDDAGDFLSDPAMELSGGGAEPPQSFAPEQVVAGRFRIVRFIARGGMGEVYEAEDLALSTRVALKTIQPRMHRQRTLELFKQEILSARRVTHPNVCRIYDIAEHISESGGPPVTLLSMELLEGPTLSRRLKEHGPFSRREALPLIQRICAGLQAAHDAGVIHRDFKSGNVILTPGTHGWRPVITDFGLALPAGSRPELHGAHAGTPGCMAPEQLEGAPATPATDVYALGVVVAGMIGCARPDGAHGSSADAQPDAAQAPENPGPWKRVIARSVEHDPEKRYHRPAEVAAALRRASARLPRSLMAIAAVTLASVFAFFWLARQPESQGMVDRQVWADPAAYSANSVSADGRYLAFTDYETGNVAVRDLRRGTNRLLTHKLGTAAWPYAANKLISPDNRQVAYVWTLDQEIRDLRIVPFAGGESRILLGAGENRAIALCGWAPDGKNLLVARELLSGARQLVWVSTAGGSVRVLKSVESFPTGASVSPDGRYIAYSGTSLEHFIFVMQADGSRETPVFQSPANDLRPRWSSDGSRLLFLSDRTGEYALWAVRMNAGKSAGAPELVRADINGPQFFPLGVTRKGALYYFAGGSRDNVFVAEVNRELTTAQRPGVEAEEFVNSNSSPSWSPDGESLAYISLRRGKATLVLQSWKTQKGREVPSRIDPYINTPVIWFPDSHSVLVAATESPKDGQRKTGFYRVDLTHGDAQLVLARATAYYDLSRTGNVLYYVTNDPVTHHWAGQLNRFNIQTGRRTELRRSEAWQMIHSVAASPDGTQLAYVLQDDKTKESSLELMPAGGGDSREVFRAPWSRGADCGVAWSPDQRYLLFVRGDGPDVSVYRVPVAGGDPVNTGITLHGDKTSTLRLPSIHPDGLRIAYQTHENFLEVRVMENYLPRAAAP
jgi:serine/threonine protein kinase/dipeptidyl aminopeptidase/acylaminoacyl peptidase